VLKSERWPHSRTEKILFNGVKRESDYIDGQVGEGKKVLRTASSREEETVSSQSKREVEKDKKREVPKKIFCSTKNKISYTLWGEKPRLKQAAGRPKKGVLKFFGVKTEKNKREPQGEKKKKILVRSIWQGSEWGGDRALLFSPEEGKNQGREIK